MGPKKRRRWTHRKYLQSEYQAKLASQFQTKKSQAKRLKTSHVPEDHENVNIEAEIETLPGPSHHTTIAIGGVSHSWKARILSEARKDKAKLKRNVKAMQEKINEVIKTHGVNISNSWSDELKNILEENFDKMTPLQKIFLDQQSKVASNKNKTSMRWHPIMIRLALNYHMKSSTSYESVKEANFITLPSKGTLFDYSHALSVQEGIQEKILKDLKSELDSKCIADHERYMCLMFDVMQVQSKLVFLKISGELVGYTKLTEVEAELQKFEMEVTWSDAEPQLVEQKLVFMIRNISCYDRDRIVKGLVAVHSAANQTAGSLYTRVWDVIYNLESYDIPVLVLTCDGASINRRFISMHAREGENDVFITKNKATPDCRSLFFMIDVPHLLKCIRNCLANSYAHKKSCLLWKNGEDISWTLFQKYLKDHEMEKFRKVQIRRHHVYLTSFSKDKVGLASFVMSRKLASGIEDDANIAEKNSKPFPAWKELVKFTRLVNDFYDCMNGHNITSDFRFRNSNLAPYKSEEDSRFKFLVEEFLGYFDEWERDVRERGGRWTIHQRKKMLISKRTLSAMRLTIQGFIMAVRFLLSKGATQVCAQRFWQDPLEQ